MKNTTNEFRYFLESEYVEVNRLFVLVYSNWDAASRGFKAKRYYLSKGFINNYKVIINEKNFYDQPIDSDIKEYKDEDYTTACLVDYEYIKYNYNLISFDLNRQKELDADPKPVQQGASIVQLNKR